MINRSFFRVIIFIFIMISFPGISPLLSEIDMTLLKRFKARSIGPAGMSGRIACIDVVEKNQSIIYVGTATGGLWKSNNGGISWKPVFDGQDVLSIGAVAIYQKNPNIIWVGTGEANPRNSVGVGRGIFKSIDAGKSWTKLGLVKSEKISRIRLHPDNPDIAYVAAMGTTWGENPERGVFRTTDGGKSWQKILYVDPRSGCADLAMAPDNPNKLIAAIWEHRRWPWFFKSGGPGSGLYTSSDGGTKWKRIEKKDGMVSGELGRIGIAFARNKPEIVYAMVEAKQNALLRSSDGGYTWRTVNNKPGLNGRPFYYCDIRINPVNENIIYSLESSIKVSEDGGKNFRRLTNWQTTHPDFHAMWTHPNGDSLVVGNDGGVVFSHDRGKNWRFVKNLPVGQFYHVSFDMAFPYNVYGGLQDNGSWIGPSMVLHDRAIHNAHWQMVGFGDGFDTEPDPENHRCGYAMIQGGNLYYYNLDTGLTRRIKPTESAVKHRYNWNAALAIDPIDKRTIYYGSQFVHKSSDKGKTWKIISPDLTTNDPEKQKQAESGGLTLDVTAAENHTTIVTIAPSPLTKDLIWVGTDDGQVQLTRNGGRNWQLVSSSIVTSKGKKKRKGKVPHGSNVPHIEASKFHEASAFVVFEDHQRSNWAPYIYKTNDYGRNWQSIATDEIDGFVHVIEQDHANPNLLFAGTEFGLFISFNGGKKWQKWTHGIPSAPVRDMQIHPRENDLIVGTHGRAIYILDDISPLREMPGKTAQQSLHLFEIPVAYQYQSNWMPVGMVSPGSDVFYGQNRTSNALISYFWNPPPKKKEPQPAKQKGLIKRGDKRLQVRIYNEKNELIRILRFKPKTGFNRFGWDMRKRGLSLSLDRNRDQDRSERGGLSVTPGRYTIELEIGDHKARKTMEVRWDPRLIYRAESLAKRDQFAAKVAFWHKNLYGLTKRIYGTIKALQLLSSNIQILPKDKQKALSKQITQLKKKLTDLKDQLIPSQKRRKGIQDRSDLLSSRFRMLYWGSHFTYDPPSEAILKIFEKTLPRLQQFMNNGNELLNKDFKQLKESIKICNIDLFAQPVKRQKNPNKKKER